MPTIEFQFVLKWTSIELRQCFEDLVSFLCQKCLQKDFPEPPVVSRFLQNLKDVLRVLAKHVAFPSEVCSVMERRTRRDRFESSISSSSFHCVSADCSLSPTVQATFSDSGDSSVDVYHFCKSHYYVADRLYSLYHMNSNMLLNIRNRVIKKEIAYWSPSIKFTREKDLEDDGFNRCILDSLVSYYCCIISDLSPKKTDSRPKHVNTVLELFDKEAVQWEVALGAEPPPTSSGINYVSFYIPRKKKPTSEHSISKKRRSVL